MKNEIGRKITSLTLMTIMFAGGMTFAFPGMMPAAHAANANLFVSAENSQFDNYMSGPQVIEVVVIDSAISDTDESKGEPDVTVNGKILRMVQAVDGNWYGYFADRDQAQIADATNSNPTSDGFQSVPGTGLDFGLFCSAAQGGPLLGLGATGLTDTVGVAVNGSTLAAGSGTNGSATGGVIAPAACAAQAGAALLGDLPAGVTSSMNVVREAKDLNLGRGVANVNPGQIGIATAGTASANALWPFIQLYPLNPTGNVVIQYNKGGGAQTTTLTFDTVDQFAGAEFDRSKYPRSAQVHVTVTDTWLNIDPTDEDSWTFGTNSTGNGTSTNYQVFDENGAAAGGAVANGIINIQGNLPNMMVEDNAVLLLNPDTQGTGTPVLSLQDTDDTVYVTRGTGTCVAGSNQQAQCVQVAQLGTGNVLGKNSQPITITEQGPNSGVFGTYDESDNSNIITTNNALRGTSATIDYNETPRSVVIGFEFATIDIQPEGDEWASGQEIPVVLVDGDANLNSRADEDLDLNNPAIALIPALQTGDPFTLSEGNGTGAFAIDVAFVAPSSDDAGNYTSGGLQGGWTQRGTSLGANAGIATGNEGGLNVTTATRTNVQAFSDRALITIVNATGGIQQAGGMVIDLETNVGDVKETFLPTVSSANGDLRGYNLLNYDFRAINATNIDVYNFNMIMNATGGEIIIDSTNQVTKKLDIIAVANATADAGLINLNATQAAVVAEGAAGIYGNNNPLQALPATGMAGSAAGSTASPLMIALYNTTGTAPSAVQDSWTVGWFINFTTDNPATATLTGSVFGTMTAGHNPIEIGLPGRVMPIVIDLFSFGFTNDGVNSGDRVSNQIVRLQLEEDGDNTSTFVGTLEYTMINQLSILDPATYNGLATIADEATFIVIEDLTDEDAPRISYLDLGADGVSTQISDQEEAPSHSGVVSFDSNTYKIADTVVVTLEDQDLNVNSDVLDIFTSVNTTIGGANQAANGNTEAVGVFSIPAPVAGLPGSGPGVLPSLNFGQLGRVLDITFDDATWAQQRVVCNNILSPGVTTDVGLVSTGFTLVETDTASGVFTGDFQIPPQWCRPTAATPETTTGLDLEVNYVDYRDASGEIIEVGDSAGIRANTGSVSLDRTVYPVPWGSLADFAALAAGTNTPTGRSVFPIHASGINDGTLGPQAAETLGNGDLTIHVRVNDPDFDISATGEDVIAQDVAAAAAGVTGPAVGPVKISVSRGANIVTLAYAGGSTPNSTGVIDVGDDGTVFGVWNTATIAANAPSVTAAGGTSTFDGIRQLGAITEIAPDAGIFELDFGIRWSDGPASATCPRGAATPVFTSLNDDDGDGAALDTANERFDAAAAAGTSFCILQGDIITVQYTDPADASGDPNTVTDSATFDLRNGVLQSDKSVYIIGGDMILTLIEPDWDLDNDAAETYDLDVIEWDSDAATVTMGNADGVGAAFDPEPTDFRETGDSTGIFQIVIEIPNALGGDNLERGEEVILEYTDWGPSGSDFVGQENEDVNLTVFTSNFGATVELDQKVYTWTDKVYITVVAPDHNFDSDLIDQIGETGLDPLKISTRGNSLNNYQLVETGTDTGIFTGEVILTGFLHDADGNPNTGNAAGQDTNPRTGNAIGGTAAGPTDGFLATDDDDGITVSYEFSEDETVVGSALIRWNIGEVQWLEASYPASGTGVVRIVDPDMNIDPEAVDNFDTDVWSDSDAGGIDLTVTETNEATGIFEGTVFFTTTDESSGHRLRVSEGDTITAEYQDNTLPDPYTTADELDITATSLIGTVVPPLERAPAANARVVDAFGNSLDSIAKDQQVQITADLANGQDREQDFAYLVQVQDSNGVTVSLAWITGSLSAGQSFSPALSWIPTEAGTYTATVFVWQSVDNPTALSPPVETTIVVS